MDAAMCGQRCFQLREAEFMSGCLSASLEQGGREVLRALTAKWVKSVSALVDNSDLTNTFSHQVADPQGLNILNLHPLLCFCASSLNPIH